MANICVLLSGSGVFDGSEIHEAVASLIAFSKAGATVQCVAPNKMQHHVINHYSGEEMDERRNVLVESARIARGNIIACTDVQVNDFDALFIPGGFGAAKNLSSFAFEGAKASIDPEVGKLIRDFHEAGKAIGAVCIAPALLALALGKGSVTIGSDKGTADALEALGATHRICSVDKAIVDPELKLVTAPAYMEDAAIHEVALGIEAAVTELLSLC